MIRRIQKLLPPFVMMVVLAGCGGSGDKWTDARPETYPVSGTVLYNDEPVEGATVIFSPVGHENGAVGLTAANGEFQLRTFEPNDGAVAGDYKVTIRKVEVISDGADGPPAIPDPTPAPLEERSFLPERYGKAASSGLTASVKEEGGNTFKFELTE